MYEEQIKWIIEQHQNTNHKYDGYLPYEFHLHSVSQIGNDFMHLLPNRWTDVSLALYGHDLIEDTRVSYNDVKEKLGEFVADIIYTVTNEKGKNRKERQSDKYYAGIQENQYALFVKLCDRMANVSYSFWTKSKMFDMYKKEHAKFKQKLYTSGVFETMWDKLESMINSSYATT